MKRRSSRAAAEAGPRYLACEILDRLGEPGTRSSGEFLRLGGALRDERDLRLATELVYGSLRRLSELDYLLSRISGRPLERIDPLLLAPLRIGLYQILHLDRVPPSAAVNESVKVATLRAGRRAGGFVNAVLRKACLRPEDLHLPPEGEHPVESLALKCSLPEWIVARWWERLGGEETRALALSLLEQAPLALWENPLHSGGESLAAELEREGVTTRPSLLLPGCLRVLSGQPQRTGAFSRGRCYVQDEASQAVVLLMGAAPGELLADLCAAPGGKSVGLASRVGSAGGVVAFDRDLSRLELLKENAARLVPGRIFAVAADLEYNAPVSGVFPGVLLDAPCTGTGILRRQPEIRWRRFPPDIPSLARRQSILLETASRLVASGGRLVYSVCSLEREEGEDQVAAFLSRHSDFLLRDPRGDLPGALRGAVSPDGYFRTWPHRHGCDGFFAAVLQRA